MYEMSLTSQINPLPAQFQQFAAEVLDPLKQPHGTHTGEVLPSVYYSNATGLFHGDWYFHDLEIELGNQTEVETARGFFNWNSKGSAKLAIKEVKSTVDGIQLLDGTLRLYDDNGSGQGMQLFLEGLHVVDNGTFVMTGVPEKHHISLATLANLTTNESEYNVTKTVIIDELDDRIKQFRGLLSSQLGINGVYNPPYSEETACDFILLSQMHQLPPDLDPFLIRELEDELMNPTGISTISLPPLRLTTLLHSPKCGVSLVIKDAPGVKIEKYNNKTINYAAMVSAMALVQIWLLISQMQYTSTPSSVSKVSYWTIMLQAAIDGYLCIFHITAGIRTEAVFTAFATCAFMFCVLVSIFGMRYLLIIWRVQRPENTPRRLANTAGADSITVPATGAILPGPVTAGPTVAATEDNARRDVSLLYARFYILLILGLVFFAQTSSLSSVWQDFLTGVVGMFLYSFWVPQIWRNVKRGSRRGLSIQYIVGMSATRLVIPLYVGLCPQNVLGQETTEWIWVLVAWVWAQMLVLIVQEFLGARFFIPERYLPPVYQYHPILPTNDAESAIMAAESAMPFPADLNNVDCAICMQPVEVPANAKANVLSRMGYMLTPCHHLMHTDCLERWMNIRLECPVCRAPLPPL